MLPTVWPGDTLVVEEVPGSDVATGDIVLFSCNSRFVAHRVISTGGRTEGSKILTRGDSVSRADAPVSSSELLGKVSFILRNGRCIEPSRSLHFSERAIAALARNSEIAARVVVGVHSMRQTSLM
jgi:hypothetical protein